mmetsp:Transcript_39679/g.58346  ORF Transcript_39679/g.58346 Transcript_39679/m.58346 type:complete len:252 (-) Transcript_39679:1118-1873(-)
MATRLMLPGAGAAPPAATTSASFSTGSGRCWSPAAAGTAGPGGGAVAASAARALSSTCCNSALEAAAAAASACSSSLAAAAAAASSSFFCRCLSRSLSFFRASRRLYSSSMSSFWRWMLSSLRSLFCRVVCSVSEATSKSTSWSTSSSSEPMESRSAEAGSMSLASRLKAWLMSSRLSGISRRVERWIHCRSCRWYPKRVRPTWRMPRSRHASLSSSYSRECTPSQRMRWSSAWIERNLLRSWKMRKLSEP